jgi:hypothetical protein
MPSNCFGRNSGEYENGSTAVFVTWDEGGGGTSNTCATNTASAESGPRLVRQPPD